MGTTPLYATKCISSKIFGFTRPLIAKPVDLFGHMLAVSRAMKKIHWNPMEHRIHFTGGIHTVQCETPSSPSLNCDSSPPPPPRGAPQAVSPAYAWVNFEKDMFCIGNIDHHYRGRFRFLLHNISAKIPKPLVGNHWASRIQTLAIRTSCQTRVDGCFCKRVDKAPSCSSTTRFSALCLVLSAFFL